jgi:hypothetical protein
MMPGDQIPNISELRCMAGGGNAGVPGDPNLNLPNPNDEVNHPQ